MAVHTLLHENECGLPLNAIEWLETHHVSKGVEREQMIQNLHLEPGSFIVDAGCGPGLWAPLLAREIGPLGRIVGVDISPEALIMAQQRSTGAWYRSIVQYKCAPMEKLPLEFGTADVIFSANVSQNLPDPVQTFAAMGHYLQPGGRLIIKDIDFGTMHFSNIDEGLQARVFQARELWEQKRIEEGYTFEDSWVGSKLASYLRQAGFEDVQEQRYPIIRTAPLPNNVRFYLQGIADWFVCEGAPYLAPEDRVAWLNCFYQEHVTVLDAEIFRSEETEFVVSGVWNNNPPTLLRPSERRVSFIS
ncbi:MAG: methyltransferase domain-containing protein [Chloroflexota bacterium]|nr:methyltransferase domain-containing protein [Chloroflexota bacterium]